MPRTSHIISALYFAALVTLAAVIPSRAPATILFAGGEDIDFTVNGTITYSTSAGGFRAGFARGSLQPANSGAGPSVNWFKLPTNLANQTILWIHSVGLQGNTLTGTTLNGEYISVFGSDGVQRLMIRGTGTASTVKVSKKDGSGTYTDLCTGTTGAWPFGSAPHKLDWFINYAVAGEVTLFVDGVQFCDFQGDVTTNGITAVNNVLFGSGGCGATCSMIYSEIVIATTDTRSMNLMTCYPVANGTNQQWTGSFANVNGFQANDSTPLTSGTSNQIAEFTCPSLPAGSFSVPAVTQSARLLKGASGPSTFRFIMRPSSGSTDYDSGSDIALTTNFTNYAFIWATNPACSCAWTTADVTTNVNQGAKSRP